MSAMKDLPNSSELGPDAELLGFSRGYPSGDPFSWLVDEGVRVGAFSAMDQSGTHAVLQPGEHVRPLFSESIEKSRSEPLGRLIAPYLSRHRVMGLGVAHADQLICEHYQYGRTAAHRFLSHSMSKSIVGLAIGIAQQRGLLPSLDAALATHLHELADVAYGETTVRELLRMSSGVKFSERYNGRDDFARFVHVMHTDGEIAALRQYNERDAKPGERFQYATPETVALGLLVRRLAGMSMSDFVAETLWRPMGAGSMATWMTGPTGLERVGGGFNATLRDYVRLGLLLASNGAYGGRQIVPSQFLTEATDWRRHPSAFAPEVAHERLGFGYHFWTLPGQNGQFLMLGIYGQALLVDPVRRLVMAHVAAGKHPSMFHEPMGADLLRLWQNVCAHFDA